MKRFKKLISIFLLMVLLVSCISSDEIIEIANGLISDGIEGIKDRDDEKVREVFGPDSGLLGEEISSELNFFDFQGDLKSKSIEVYESIFENVSYKINEAEKIDGIWTLDVDFESNNMKDVILASTQDMKDRIIKDQDALDSGLYNEELLGQIYMDGLIENINSGEFIGKFNIDLQLKGEGKDLLINADQNFINALLGNLIDDAPELEKQVEIIFDELNRELDIKLDEKNDSLEDLDEDDED